MRAVATKADTDPEHPARPHRPSQLWIRSGAARLQHLAGELRDAVAELSPQGSDDADELLRRLDENGDGSVSAVEFQQFVLGALDAEKQRLDYERAFALKRPGSANGVALAMRRADGDVERLLDRERGRVRGRCKRGACARTEGSPCPGTEGSPAAEAQLVGIRRNEYGGEAQAHPTAVWPTYHCSVVGQVLLPWFGRSTELAACKALESKPLFQAQSGKLGIYHNYDAKCACMP